jgi:teichoic acid transport system permease protein
MIILNFAMFIVPPFFAWVIHNYLRHGDMSGKRKAVFAVVYFVLINLCTFAISYVRGVKHISFNDMTFSYRLKYMGLGCVLGFVLPFFVCLLTEDQITIGGFKRYIHRFINDIRKYFPYAVRSAKADLRSEVANSYLNWMWWLIEPVCMMLIYTLIFGVVFNAKEKFFPVFIFIGITMWGFFSRSINGSVNIVRANKGIITKVYMPKYILLLSKMFVNAFKMMVSFGVILVMMIFYRVKVTINILYVIPILLVLFLFTFGVGTILMHYGVYVNDLGYITGIVISMLMYFTGTFYSVSKRIPAPFGTALEVVNPIAFLISGMRNILLYGGSISITLLFLWTFISIVIIALGVFTIYSNENSYVKVI